VSECVMKIFLSSDENIFYRWWCVNVVTRVDCDACAVYIYIYILWSVSGINIFFLWGVKIFFVGGV